LQIDGNYFKIYKNVKHTCIIKGDEKVKGISAASILAKTQRDQWIIDHVENELKSDIYHLKQNKGYGTKKHIQAIVHNGPNEYHRKSFLKKIKQTQQV